MLERLPLPEIEEAGLDVVLVAQVRDGDLVGQVAAQQRGLVFGAKLAAGGLFSGCMDSSVPQSMERWASHFN